MASVIKKRSRPTQRIREVSLEAEDENAEQEVEEKTIPLEDLIEFRKFRKAREGIDVQKLNAGDKKKRKKAQDDDAVVEEGGLRMGARKEVIPENEEERKEEKARRAVRTSNFTQQTNALDVDKHMMAYIEENIKAKRGQQDNADEGPSSTPFDPQEELFKLPEKYKVHPTKKEEEGSVMNSVSMLTAIPEVDLGMDTRLKNIEETEKAKRAVADERKEGKKRTQSEEEFLAATRFYKPHLKHKSDAEILREAKLEAMGIKPERTESRRQRHDRVQTATDEIVMERFKKRMRK